MKSSMKRKLINCLYHHDHCDCDFLQGLQGKVLQPLPSVLYMYVITWIQRVPYHFLRCNFVMTPCMNRSSLRPFSLKSKHFENSPLLSGF